MNREMGHSLILVLILLAVGALLVVPTLNYVWTALKFRQISNELLIGEYSADAGMVHAVWRLLHEPGFADSLNDVNPSANWLLEINGITVPITVTFVPSTMFLEETLPGPDIDYTIPAGHYLEFKVIVTPEADDDVWFAYDTVDCSASILLPTGSGTLTYYWHNNPTPPIEDTVMQHPLPLDTTAPLAETLYNYDTDRDDFSGRLVQKGGEGPGETDPVEYQEWRTTSPFEQAVHIQGKVGLLYWWGMKDFTPDKTAAATFYLRDFDGSAYTEIGETTIIQGEWARIFDFRSTYRDSTIEGRLQLHKGKVAVLSFQLK